MKLILVRHGETQEERDGIILGHLSGIITLKGIEKSKKIAVYLSSSDIKPDIIFSSDLARAKITAEIISEATGVKIEYDALLRERKAGTAEGKKESEIDWMEYEKQPGLSRRHPGGESFEEVRARAEKFIFKLSQGKAETAVVVSHSAFLAMLVSLLSDTDPEVCLKMDSRSFLTIADTKKQGVERVPLAHI